MKKLLPKLGRFGLLFTCFFLCLPALRAQFSTNIYDFEDLVAPATFRLMVDLANNAPYAEPLFSVAIAPKHENNFGPTATNKSLALAIDCANVSDATLSCRADLPPVDFDLLIVTSTSEVTPTALTIIPGNSACIGDTLFVDRTYFVQNEEGDMGQCEQQFTIVSSAGPTIVCPANSPIDCGTLPTVSAANATVTGDCEALIPTVTGPVVVGAADAVGTTYTYTYTVTDLCGRSASCEQVFTVQDTVAPTLTCNPTVTIALSAAGTASLTNAQLGFTQNDNCQVDPAGPFLVTGTLQRNYSCADAGAVRPLDFFARDLAGNVSTNCRVTLRIVDDIAPVITVTPADITLDSRGRATLRIADVAAATDACGIRSIVASDLNLGCDDIGQRFVQITATDNNGNVSTAPVAVNTDFEQPSLACIGAINVTLSDQCSATLIPDQVLRGNIACLDAFAFEIVVMDSNPANGPVIDGCGSFNYIIRSVGTGLIDLDFESCWGVVNAEDKTPPVVTSRPTSPNLLCVDYETGNNTVSTLPSTVSRCYQVFANNRSATASGQVGAVAGAVVSGSMAPALRARLLAGGTLPLLPTFADGCAARIEVCVNDVVTFGADPTCDDITITRTFLAREAPGFSCGPVSGTYNGTVSASFQLFFTRPTLDNLDTQNLVSTVSYNQCGILNPSRADYPAPRPADFPSLNVNGRIFNLSVGQGVCNIGVTFSDGPAIQTCDFTYKFVRTYTVIDWCEPSDIRTFTQVVKVGDETAPVLTGPTVPRNAAGDLVYGTNAGNTCAAFIRLDDIRVVDNCSGTNVTVSARIFPGGNLNASPIGAFVVRPGGTPEVTTAIPAGRHLLRYTYADVCGNTGTTDFFFVVEDQTAPVAICENGLNISIGGGTNGGFAVLTAANLDAGSYDDCSAITRSIARVGANNQPIGGEAAYGPTIRLDCADVGTVRVGLRVTDASNRSNFCWLDVIVEDKLRPTCVAPGPLTITCDDYNETLPANIANASIETLNTLFGNAVGVDNCGTNITQTVSGSVNNCGVGRLTRRFVTTDPGGFTNTNSCEQIIEVVSVHDYRLTFPVDVRGECAVIPAYNGISNEGFGCDLITTTVDVDTLRTQLAGEECFKLRLTYDVVNWCEYNSLGQPYVIARDANGALNRSREPRNLEADPLFLNVIPRVTTGANARNDDFAFLTLLGDRNFNAGGTQNDQALGTNYGVNNSRGFFRYTQFVKIYDEVAPVITLNRPAECFVGNGAACQARVELSFRAVDECSAASVRVELDPFYNAATGFVADAAVAAALNVRVTSSAGGNFLVTATGVPAGNHAIRVRASDGCGNFDVRILEFCVVADRTPTPICIQTLTVVLADDGNNGGVAEIWGSDFIASPIRDCSGNLVTKYSLYRADNPAATIANARFSPPTTNGIRDIDCDDLANGTVRVRLFAFDNLNSAPNFCEVVVEVQDNAGHCGGSNGDLSGLIATDNDEVKAGVSVTLTGAMNMATTTGANGSFRFTGLEAGADYTVQPSFTAAPNMRNIKTSDLTYMIGNILGRLEFDSPYDYIASDVNRDRNLNIFDVIATSQLILGIQTGFVGGNWVFVDARATINSNNPYAVAFPEVYNVNNLNGNLTEVDFVAVELGNPFHEVGRSVGYLKVEDVRLEAGQTHLVELDGSALAGFQGTIKLAAGLELVAADYVGEGGLNLNRAGEGLIALSLREQAVLRLEVRATTAGQLSELLSLTDDITIREGVAMNGLSNGLDLAFTPSFAPAAAPTNVLHQNMPNPVTDVTSIRFELAVAGPATLKVQDVAGGLILVRELEANAGLNTVELDNINATGVLTYTLTSGKFSATRKMVVVR